MSHELSAHPCFDRHLPWEGPRGSEPPPRACWEHTAGPAGHPGPGPETSLPLRELGGRCRATSLHFLTVKKGTKPMGAGTGSGSFSELVRPCASWTVYTASICLHCLHLSTLPQLDRLHLLHLSTLPPSVYIASICLHCLSWRGTCQGERWASLGFLEVLKDVSQACGLQEGSCSA